MTNQIISQFKEIPASKKSTINRKPIYGVGINDSDYITTYYVNGEFIKCHFYERWVSMIKRCYSKKFQEKYPTYIECIVCDEWLIFSNFKKWMIKQNWKGKHLDKDIIIPGNKIYSPENCVFVTSKINTLLGNCKASRGIYPQGVSFSKQINRFRANSSINGKKKYLGCFKTQEEASNAYKKFKLDHIVMIANEQIDKRIKKGLILHAEFLCNKQSW